MGSKGVGEERGVGVERVGGWVRREGVSTERGRG